MDILFYSEEYLESVVDILHDMSIHYNGENASSREAVRTNLINHILSPTSGVTLVVAVEVNRVVGLATISLLYPAPKETGQLFMKELYVASDRRGKGIGGAMMHWVANYAVSKNCVRFDWTVDSDNKAALQFYRTLGAKHVTDKLYFRFAGDQLRDFAAPNTR